MREIHELEKVFQAEKPRKGMKLSWWSYVMFESSGIEALRHFLIPWAVRSGTE